MFVKDSDTKSRLFLSSFCDTGNFQFSSVCFKIFQDFFQRSAMELSLFVRFSLTRKVFSALPNLDGLDLWATLFIGSSIDRVIYLVILVELFISLRWFKSSSKENVTISILNVLGNLFRRIARRIQTRKGSEVEEHESHHLAGFFWISCKHIRRAMHH
jgi:hypothetical protein